MEISSASAQALDTNVQVGVEKQVLDTMKAQGAELNKLIASASAPIGSVNSPSQGRFVDAFA